LTTDAVVRNEVSTVDRHVKNNKTHEKRAQMSTFTCNQRTLFSEIDFEFWYE